MTPDLAAIVQHAAAHSAPVPAPLAWMAATLPDARRRRLGVADLARIDSYQGGGTDLHAFVAALAPLARAAWYETTVTAQHGTVMHLGYLAVPAGASALDVGWVCYAPAFQRLLGPVGPSHVTASDMTRPADCTDFAYRELRAAVGITLRAMLLGCGEVVLS